jgi:hypothetical protein
MPLSDTAAQTLKTHGQLLDRQRRLNHVIRFPEYAGQLEERMRGHPIVMVESEQARGEVHVERR